ncbi:MAG: molecular chaperone TorD family protein [Cyanobacteria bacterium SZAS LIN-3]|nr:molecular chaperone TorD family protein [Cyanobacteria bacterium SZAS LIN-3]MBS2006833.1 molecular chaperone TorD family protein [Cyanobacteria bacterium SZAS TMP-1]
MSVQIGTKKGIALAQLGLMLDYPVTGQAHRIHSLVQSVASSYPKAVKLLSEFDAAWEQKSLSEFEELYTRTFDLAAICSPYVSGYIFGDENFDRGTLMATLGDKYAELAFDSCGELPDHLSVLLRFSSLLDQEALDELVEHCLLAPVTEMTDRLKDSDNPYYFLVSAILTVLKIDHPGA